MPGRIALANWNRYIWKALTHPAVEITLFVLAIVASAWVIADSEEFTRQSALPVVGPR